MMNDQIEPFLHGQGAKPKVAAASLGEVLRAVLLRNNMILEGQTELFVFAGECEDSLQEPEEMEDGVDEHAPVDIDLTLEVLEIHRHRHVHCNHCRHVALEVNFGGNAKRHRFSPAATVGVAAQWARRKFRLDPEAAAEYVLQMCGSTTQPRSDEHLGELVKTTCSICFDLVKEVTPQG
jgi:hypothetical protein